MLLDECPGDQLGSNEKFENLYEATDGVELETRTPPAITMTQASFAWAPDGEPFLTDITLRCDEPKLYMCVGPVASVCTFRNACPLG